MDVRLYYLLAPEFWRFHEIQYGNFLIKIQLKDLTVPAN
jgi:hypothetical protein